MQERTAGGTVSKAVHDAIAANLIAELHGQLGWSLGDCEKQIRKEEERRIPRSLIAKLQHRGWQLQNASVLDLGAGLGGLVQELLQEGNNAYGIEPSPDSAAVARLRVAHAGFASRIIEAKGEQLPFPDNAFDYVICLQVLEHVAEPGRIFREMYRVLKPGGRCFVSCENYLAFREQEYRVPWLPLLPKPIAARYLQLLGRDPAFLLEHVHYVTYPKVWREAQRAGFINLTYQPHVNRFKRVPKPLRSPLVHTAAHALNVFGVGVRVDLQKPKR